jgi:hypothetical protein
MHPNQTKAVLLAVLLFCFGITVGALGHRYYVAGAVSAKTAEDYRQKYVGEMQSRLKLDAHQVAQLQVILDQTKARVKAVREKYHPEMVAVKDAQLKRVESILKPDQIKEYKRMVAEREQHAKEQEERDRREDQRQAEAHQKALNGQ